MSARFLHEQRFCTAQVRCEGTAIPPHSTRTTCVPCAEHLERQARGPKPLRGARDRFTKREGRRTHRVASS